MTKAVPDLLCMLRALIACPSVSSANPDYDQGNRAVIDLLAEWLEALGFAVEITPLGERKANLIARLGNGGDGNNGLVLSGHTDTVPYDENRWTVPPFELTEKNDRLYGLGTADMKSFLALVVESVRHVSARELKRPVTVLATADEESTMAGARALVKAGRKLGRFALIGEPTKLRPVRMHKGVMMESIRITGKAGHSSDPSLGASAIEGTHAVLAELFVWRRELQERYRDPLFEVDRPTLNVGSIHGGDNPNRICAFCETQIDIRPLPGMDLQELRLALSRRLARVIESRPPLTMEIRPIFDGVPPFETPAASAIVKSCETLTGQPAGSIAFGTEGPFLAQLGMETVILGPGSIEQAHQPDEYIASSQLQPTLELLRKLIDRYCARAED